MCSRCLWDFIIFGMRWSIYFKALIERKLGCKFDEAHDSHNRRAEKNICAKFQYIGGSTGAVCMHIEKPRRNMQHAHKHANLLFQLILDTRLRHWSVCGGDAYMYSVRLRWCMLVRQTRLGCRMLFVGAAPPHTPNYDDTRSTRVLDVV